MIYFKTNNISIYNDDILKITSIPEGSVDLSPSNLINGYENSSESHQ